MVFAADKYSLIILTFLPFAGQMLLLTSGNREDRFRAFWLGPSIVTIFFKLTRYNFIAHTFQIVNIRIVE